MKYAQMTISFHVMTAVLLLSVTTQAETVTVAPDRIEVVLARGCPSTVTFAAQEMTNFLSRALDAAVPIANRPTEGRYSLILGANEWSKEAGLDASGLPRDSFIIRIGKNRTHIVGVDENIPRLVEGMNGNGKINGSLQDNQRATLFGVYEFLESAVGCRFYFPGEFGEIVPKHAVLKLTTGEKVHSPSVLQREYYHPTHWFVPGPVRWIEGERIPQGIGYNYNWLRLRMATVRIPFCHGLCGLKCLQRFGKSHPEYFAMDDRGGRWNAPRASDRMSENGYLCFSSGVVDEIYADAKAYLTGQPAESRKITRRWDGKWGWPSGMRYGRYVDLMPFDGHLLCQCPACKPHYAKKGKNGFGEIIWNYTGRVAQRLIDEKVPGTVTQMAYAEYSQVPEIDLPTNIMVMVAVKGPFGIRNRAVTTNSYAKIRAWKKKTGNVMIWTYPDKYGSLELPGVPTMTPRAWAEFTKETAGMIAGCFAEAECDSFYFNHLNFYVYSRLMWDAHADVEAIFEEYYRLMYGPAAATVRTYFEELEDVFLNEVCGAVIETSEGPLTAAPSVHEIWTRVYTPARLDRWDRMLDAGARLLPKGSDFAKRYAVMRRELQGVMRATSDGHRALTDPQRNLARLRRNPPVRDLLAGIPRKRWRGQLDPAVTLTGEPSFFCCATNGRAQCSLPLSAATGAILKPNTRYRLTYFLKCADVVPTQGAKYHGAGGARVVIATDWNTLFPKRVSFKGTFDWMHQAFEFTTPDLCNLSVESSIDLSIGGANGKAWFDGVSLEELPDAAIAPNRLAIVVEEGCPAATAFAALELKRLLGKAFGGVKVPICRTVQEDRYSIILGTNHWSRAAKLDPTKLAADGFLFKTATNRLYIVGCDTPGRGLYDRLKAGERPDAEFATLLGVREFLTRHCNMRFFHPGELGECVPALTELRVPPLDRTFAPAKRLRRYGAEERNLTAEQLFENYVADRQNMYPGSKQDCIRRDYWFTISQGRDDISWYLIQALRASKKTPADTAKINQNLGYAERFSANAKDPALLLRYVAFWRKSIQSSSCGK